MTEKADYLRKLVTTSSLRESVIRSAIEVLNLPEGSCGLDAGCGAGQLTLLLSNAVGPGGRVTGLDIVPEFLEYGIESVESAGRSDQISFQEGSLQAIPFDDDTFDWAWSSDCVGYGPWDPLPLLSELARVVKQGGIIAILAWSSEKLLPGYPRLEARLQATTAGIAPFVNGRDPGLHFLRALDWFRELGFEEPSVQTFSSTVNNPLRDDFYQALVELFEMRWPGVEDELEEKDLLEFQRLCLPGSPDFILDLPDYCAFFTYTRFWGRVAR